MTKTPNDAEFRQALEDMAGLADKLAPIYKDAAELINALTDLAALVEKIAPVCPSTKDLVGILTLAIENDGQLRMVRTLLK